MAAVEKDLSESKRQLAQANERNHNQQKAEEKQENETRKLKQENEQLREELKKERNFRRDRLETNGNDPEESSNPCSFLWSWFSQSHNSAESNLHWKIRWDQGNLFVKFQVCYNL